MNCTALAPSLRVNDASQHENTIITLYLFEPFHFESHYVPSYIMYPCIHYTFTYLPVCLSINDTIRGPDAGSYIDVCQVQGGQMLMVSLPQYGRPALSCDGTRQHGALADGYCGDAHFLVIGQGEQVHIC